MKKIALIGCTGSIGRQVIKVCLAHPDSFKIVALCAGRDAPEFRGLVEKINPKYFGVDDENLAKVDEADIVFNAASGFAGLKYTLAAIEAGKDIALSNKETLVAGADIVLPAAKRADIALIPVDSEHSAIWQCTHFGRVGGIKRLIITASGGPFRKYSKKALAFVTPQEALAHPTWQMGAKISVDSATLLNKGYEVIEGHALFGTPYENIEAVIQPDSIVHSLVEYADGSVLAQLSYPTMEIPIQLALSYPKRLESAATPMDFKKPIKLSFEPLERKKYPLFDFALKCGEEGGIAPCALNAADEVAVAAFLEGRLPFLNISDAVKYAVTKVGKGPANSFGRLKEVDEAARAYSSECINNHIYRHL